MIPLYRQLHGGRELKRQPARMNPHSTESNTELRQQIQGMRDLNALLDLLGAEIDALGTVDGYLVNLRDADGEFLVTLKLRLTEPYRALEDTYYRYRTALAGGDALNVNTRAYHGREIVQCDLQSASDLERAMLQAWKLQQIAATAILDDDNFDEAPIGTLLLLKKHGHIEETVFAEIEDLISLFYQPLKHALEASYVQADRARLISATLDHSRFLHFVVELNNLTSTDTIYPTFATEVFRQFAFDGIGFFLLENGLLVNKRVEVADPHYEAIGQAWQAFLHAHPYQLHTADGGVAHTFVKNLPLLFHDVQQIMDLPMSDKDRQSLKILQTARTLLLVPICEGVSPRGVLAFYSLQNTVDIAEAELRTICKLADCFGAALDKIETHRGT
jgi:hypothetical protein